MARGVRRGEVWRYRFRSPDKPRPVVVLNRPEVIGFLHTVMSRKIARADGGKARESA
jgi:hypothetical protein